MKDEKTKKKRTSVQNPLQNSLRLRTAVDTIAQIINQMAADMKVSLESGEVGDIKQLKELTMAAKELAAVMHGLDGEKQDSTEEVRVVFKEDSEKWAE